MEGYLKEKVAPFWSAETVAQACKVTNSYGPNVEKQWPILFEVASLYGLQDRLQLAAMCGVIGHESAGRWWPVHENLVTGDRLWDPTFSRYGYSASGECYGGHGLIQTTWKGNHETANRIVKEKTGTDYDLINHPHRILGDPVLAAHCACIYWLYPPAGTGVLQYHAARKDYGEVIHYVWGLNAPGNPHFDNYYAKLKYAAEYLLAR